MIIIHGTDQIKTSQKLDQILESVQIKGRETEKINAANLTPAGLSQFLTPSSLFSDNRQIIIYNLLSLPQSNNKKKLIQLIKVSKQSDNLILYENQLIHPATIKSLTNAKVFQFKTNPLIYSLLESLVPGKPEKPLAILNQLEQNQEPIEMLFFILARHIRQLIQAKSPQSLKLAPWQIKKLSQQSTLFTTEQLINFHQKLYQIDKRQKLSQVKDLKTELCLCILENTAL